MNYEECRELVNAVRRAVGFSDAVDYVYSHLNPKPAPKVGDVVAIGELEKGTEIAYVRDAEREVSLHTRRWVGKTLAQGKIVSVLDWEGHCQCRWEPDKLVTVVALADSPKPLTPAFDGLQDNVRDIISRCVDGPAGKEDIAQAIENYYGHGADKIESSSEDVFLLDFGIANNVGANISPRQGQAKVCIAMSPLSTCDIKAEQCEDLGRALIACAKYAKQNA